mgnify:CR=1 FL=1
MAQKESKAGARTGKAKKAAATPAKSAKSTRTAAKPKSRKRPAAATPKVSSQSRLQMIAETAYYHAERRGFAGGDPLNDWLQAEAEVDAHLQRAG